MWLRVCFDAVPIEERDGFFLFVTGWLMSFCGKKKASREMVGRDEERKEGTRGSPDFYYCPIFSFCMNL